MYLALDGLLGLLSLAWVILSLNYYEFAFFIKKEGLLAPTQ
jgi:hypothetical protein